jgi:glyoxylase-like metal-dependent hydrolase (beta-lactamase superfamily II)
MSASFITSLEGNRQWLDGGSMFGNVPRPLWERWIVPDGRGRIPLACRCLLIETEGVKVLCETGIGAFFDPKMAERFGVEAPDHHRLLENLTAAGHSPDSIDYVILSHLHFDHAGGLLSIFSSGLQELVFPKARFVVGDEAWERALHPHARDKASFIPGLTDKLQASGRLLLYPRDRLPEPLERRFEFLTSDGHTPGQLHTLFKGDQHKVFFCGDLVPGRSWVHLPITMGYDRYPERLIDEKAQIYQRAEAEQWLLFYTHDAEVAGSHVKMGKDQRFEPIDSQAQFNHWPV